MKLTSQLPPADRERVEGRLRSNLIAWLTTVRPDGQPVTVPVWFVLRDDETILVYSGPEKEKLRNIAVNPKVSFALDVTDIGRNIVRLEGTARRARDQPSANEHPAYLAKYTERLAAMFGTPDEFAALFRPRSSLRRPNCIPSARRWPAERDGCRYWPQRHPGHHPSAAETPLGQDRLPGRRRPDHIAGHGIHDHLVPSAPHARSA
jgi:PPOX class probable F420-dependent enzyme